MRLLYLGEATLDKTGPIYFASPRQQQTMYGGVADTASSRVGVNTFPSLTNPSGGVTVQSILLNEWRLAAGNMDHYEMSPIDKYLAGEVHPFARQWRVDWATVPLDGFSKRLTTAFNTYWEGTLDPFNHTSVAFRKQLTADEIGNVGFGLRSIRFFNQTEGVATVTYSVYRANRHWVIILMITTVVLEILAVIGAILQLFIYGPDILGFASSLTRQNPHVGLSPGGSWFDGPARARALGNLRVNLSDACPEEEAGFVAFQAVLSIEKHIRDSDASWRPLGRKRPYF